MADPTHGQDPSRMDVAQILLQEPAVLAIWIILIALTGPALAVLASPEGVRRPGQALRHTAETLRGYHTHHHRRQTADTTRYAQEITAAAHHATATAQRWHQHWQQTQHNLDNAWQAWQDADARLARSRAAAAFPVPQTAATPAQYAERERFLHRTLLAAARNGQLPINTVADALTGRGDWDPRLHPAEQELQIHRAAAAYLAQRYQQAAAAERLAWHDTQLAAATRDSLRTEAATTTQAPDTRHQPAGTLAHHPAKTAKTLPAHVTRAA
ncbi:hypothetical protein QLQ12_46785 [Actinoplanes sp. NEAU-A12]|uniref:Uncharacterized protein n=1 Tax=Actinoplanes sandaracinus TaxID=3045177 RepID=A0ABT6X2B5_9ACTN|nr:hypothetical protein [Actinoplanes sandaracinus]MDI6106087.1 hypothetical protein [Actinoplanes sandaracinus]